MHLTLIAGCLASISFLFHYSQKNLNMLGNNKNVITAAPALKPESTHSPYTVIGGGVCVEGHLVSSGHVEIYDEVKGNIQVDNGLVRVMSSGKVNGNITCNKLYVDGEVTGECNAK